MKGWGVITKQGTQAQLNPLVPEKYEIQQLTDLPEPNLVLGDGVTPVSGLAKLTVAQVKQAIGFYGSDALFDPATDLDLDGGDLG